MRIKQDKIHHFVYSAFLTYALTPFLGLVGGVSVVLIIGMGKELWWDRHLGRGTPDWADMFANVIGVIFAVYIMGR